MKRIDLGQTIGILANVGVIAGLVFLGYEIRQNRTVARQAACNGFTQQRDAVNLSLANDAELAELVARAVQGAEVGDFTPAELIRIRLYWRTLRSTKISQSFSRPSCGHKNRRRCRSQRAPFNEQGCTIEFADKARRSVQNVLLG